MSTLSQYLDGTSLQIAMQNGLSKYINSATLAANVATTLTVPTDEHGQLARYVTFGKGQATTDNFYARCFNANDSVDRTTGGTFSAYTTNGTFASDTGWTKGTGWTISAGTAVGTTASSSLSQTAAIALIPGYTYTITFDVTRSAGSVKAAIGGTVSANARSTNATFTETIVAGSTGLIEFVGTGFTGTIDNVIVTAWVLGVTDWTTDNSTAIASNATSTTLSQTANTAYPLVNGQSYLVKFTATRSAGDVAVSLGGGTAGTSRQAGTFSEIIVAGATQAITFTGNGFTGTIDNVTILACAQVPSNVTTGLGAEQNPTGYFLGNDHIGSASTKVSTISIVSAATPIITASFYK